MIPAHIKHLWNSFSESQSDKVCYISRSKISYRQSRPEELHLPWKPLYQPADKSRTLQLPEQSVVQAPDGYGLQHPVMPEEHR